MQSTAAELWSEWVRSGVVRPQDYDADVADALRATLTAQGHDDSVRIDDSMLEAVCTARDLLHALAPLVSSFCGMQRDLLRLLERVAASSGTEQSLRVRYEFVEGDIVDESLADFRESIRRLEKITTQLQPLVFSASHAFDLSLRRHPGTWETVEELFAISESTSPEHWPFSDGVPDPVPTGDPRVDDRATRVIQLVRHVVGRLESVGADTVAAREWMYSHGDDLEQDGCLHQIILAATDFWPLTTAAAVYRWTACLAAGGEAAPDDLLAEIDVWLDGFEADDPEETTLEQTVDELVDVLALPVWGKRHELYSAWIAAELDRALDSRLEFVITDGALRFPFHATLLAHLLTADGPVELWSEVRSPATGALGGGRKRGIQPDYRFQRTAVDSPIERRTVAAIEVKQYKTPAASRHRSTLQDYVGNLPDAAVFLVAHGPLGAGIVDVLPEPSRKRARVHPNVRRGRPRESAAFRAEIARVFPPPVTRPTRIELRWSPAVHDLDLHVRGGEDETSYRSRASAHSTLRSDEVAGGPEIVDVSPDAAGPLDVRVHVYSRGTIRTAAPVVTVIWSDHPAQVLLPRGELALRDERWWNVGRLDDSVRMTPTEQSREYRSDTQSR